MGLITKNRKVKWVDKASIHRMSVDQARAFIACLKGMREAHREAIDRIDGLINDIKDIQSLQERKGDFSLAYGNLGGEKRK